MSYMLSHLLQLVSLILIQRSTAARVFLNLLIVLLTILSYTCAQVKYDYSLLILPKFQ